ncbi:hypothetical protein BGZ99_002104 [Dissophora globulifera]|uniref:Lysosomal dipeptide transporter MFSD1 n=1 Tax=Dissophora globulifera TaxID=979702 RepID=A0A9P6RYE4_9FUNG|nr:hypothetical protein BGZ99_002104 [Dissophora globulifera]
MDRHAKLSPSPTNIDELICDSSPNTTDLEAVRIHDLQTHKSAVERPHGSRIRWAILASACLVMFGNYYAYDNPAALNQPLQDYMQLPDDKYAYLLNLLYTTYSIPNIILPWFGGYAADRFGHRKLLVSLSVVVALGDLIVCLGVQKRNIPTMLVGRVVFGAAESLAVVQSAITVKYFRGKELAMALGINLCVSRLGSVLNDVLTPYIWSKSSVPVAFWAGSVSSAQIMTVPDLLSAVLILPIGYFVDHFGKKSWLFMLCGLIIGTSHAVLGLVKIPTPVPCLIALGFASAITAIFSSAVPVLVRNDQLATGYGLLASAYNLAFVVFPLIVAKLMTVDPAVYRYTEIFFSSVGFLGFLLSVWIKLLDRNGDLDRKEIKEK